MRIWRTFLAASLLLTAGLQATEIDSQHAGPAIGSTVNSFYVRAVTGPFAGKSVCYVCRNGDRPVVVVFLRELNADAQQLLKRLDETVNTYRGRGLRCFVVLFSDTFPADASRLQTLAFDNKLELPLTLATEPMAGAIAKNLPKDAVISVVTYDHLKVQTRFHFQTGECDTAAHQSIIDSARELVSKTID